MAQNFKEHTQRSIKRLLHQKPVRISGANMHIGSDRVVSFTSAGFLGLHQHPAVARAVKHAVREWPVSLGFTRILGTDPFTLKLEQALAELVSQPAAMVFSSSSQLAMDALPLLAGSDGRLFVDRQAYATSWAGVRLAEGQNTEAINFDHNDPFAIDRLCQTAAHRQPRIIVIDGVYSPAGEKARLNEFVHIAESYDATIFMDDSNGIGIFGARPEADMPYGRGGSGTAAYKAVSDRSRIIHTGSLAKAFGVPVAFIAGSEALIQRLRNHSSTTVHCSPPSIPNLASALAAMDLHRIEGENLRRILFNRVRLFRHELQSRGIELASSHHYPIQTLALPHGAGAVDLAADLRRCGIWVVLQIQPKDRPGEDVLRFLITALHSKAAITRAVETVTALFRKMNVELRTSTIEF